MPALYAGDHHVEGARKDANLIGRRLVRSGVQPAGGYLPRNPAQRLEGEGYPGRDSADHQEHDQGAGRENRKRVPHLLPERPHHLIVVSFHDELPVPLRSEGDGPIDREDRHASVVFRLHNSTLALSRSRRWHSINGADQGGERTSLLRRVLGRDQDASPLIYQHGFIRAAEERSLVKQRLHDPLGIDLKDEHCERPASAISHCLAQVKRVVVTPFRPLHIREYGPI